MAPKKKEASAEKVEEEKVEPQAPTPVPKKEPLPRRVKPPKLYTFEQWVKMRSIKTQHVGGLRAYCPNVKKSRTLEDWDECFRGY